MQTSYAIISIYKQRIATLDRAIHNPPRQGGQHQNSHSSKTVEYRKLLQRFRQFLAEEEKFWMQLVLRLRRYFMLDASHSFLTTDDASHEASNQYAPIVALPPGVLPKSSIVSTVSITICPSRFHD